MSLFRLKNIWEPAELVRFLITANIVMFTTALLIAPFAVNTTFSPMVFLSPSTSVLFKLGASGTIPVFSEDRWWTLITANYLHGSLLHLIFNVSALRSVGKISIDIFAPSRFFLIYCLGGAASMAVSSLAGIPLTLGASGAISQRGKQGKFAGRPGTCVAGNGTPDRFYSRRRATGRPWAGTAAADLPCRTRNQHRAVSRPRRLPRRIPPPLQRPDDSP